LFKALERTRRLGLLLSLSDDARVPLYRRQRFSPAFYRQRRESATNEAVKR